MSTGPTINRGSSEQSVETPDEFIRAVEQKFGPLDWDLACTVDNVKAIRGYTYPEFDALTKNWAGVGAMMEKANPLLWLNPEFANIAPWAQKCAEEREQGAEILLLVPQGSQNWYWNWVQPYADVYWVGRMKFVGHTTAYPKDLILAHYHKHSIGALTDLHPVRWRWQDD